MTVNPGTPDHTSTKDSPAEARATQTWSPVKVSVPSAELQDLIGDSADLVGCRCGIEHSLEQLAEEFTLPRG